MTEKKKQKYEMKWWKKVILVWVFVTGVPIFLGARQWEYQSLMPKHHNDNLTVAQAKKAYMGRIQVKNEKAADFEKLPGQNRFLYKNYSKSQSLTSTFVPTSTGKLFQRFHLPMEYMMNAKPHFTVGPKDRPFAWQATKPFKMTVMVGN